MKNGNEDEKHEAIVGSKDPKDLFLAVGAALTAWETLDERQGFLFVQLSKGENYLSPSASSELAYGFTNSYSMRCDFVLLLANRVFDKNDPILERIKNTLKETRKLCEFRNHIAHGIVRNLTIEGEDK